MSLFRGTTWDALTCAYVSIHKVRPDPGHASGEVLGPREPRAPGLTGAPGCSPPKEAPIGPDLAGAPGAGPLAPLAPLASRYNNNNNQRNLVGKVVPIVSYSTSPPLSLYMHGYYLASLSVLHAMPPQMVSWDQDDPLLRQVIQWTTVWLDERWVMWFTGSHALYEIVPSTVLMDESPILIDQTLSQPLNPWWPSSPTACN
ncbi:hypothetical protein PG997_011065 [Apiospora hydei]|uniref:Uncharacterized protein n=1 Tax=Apiospora hydei TaxID=1337664 RepID=A0ABR1VI17_9PEZI